MGCAWGREGKMVSRTEGNIEDLAIGGDPAKPEAEGTESTVVTCIDIVLNHLSQETSFTKEASKVHQRLHEIIVTPRPT